jgi:DNA excision repair protein ERCC-4
VDVREFRSSLPGLLHAANLVIEPLTLSIGDYILSPEMCVERKAIPDLIQSFNSGRLYQQCELMSIYYRHPILLIEFDQKKSFSLQTYTDPKSTTAAPSDTDLQAKLVLLTLTFPKLRIIWSSSPYVTADIFKELKAGWHEPEAERAVALGAEDQFGNPLNAEGSSDTSVNLVAQELLRTLPGITSKNFRYVMRKTENLEELLSQMTVEQLGELIGLEAARQLLKFADENSID